MNVENANYNIHVERPAVRGIMDASGDFSTTTIENLFVHFENLQFLKASSASPTVFISGNLKHLPDVTCFFKFFPLPAVNGTPISVDLQLLIDEAKIYTSLLELRAAHVTPHILARVKNYTVELSAGQIGFFSSPLMEALTYDDISAPCGIEAYFVGRQKQLMRKFNAHPDVLRWSFSLNTWKKTMCIVTCSIEKSLQNLLDANAITSYKDVLCIVFQVIYTLFVFEQLEVAHHDLHLGNIRVEVLNSPIDIYYDIGQTAAVSQCVKMSTKYIVKLFDFDRSSIYKTTRLQTATGHRDIKRNYTASIYKFNTFNNKEDSYKFLRIFLGNFAAATPLINELMTVLIPGLNNTAHTIKAVYDTQITEREMPAFQRIISNQVATIPDMETYLSSKTFKDFFTASSQNFIISFPPHHNLSLYSIYLPDSIMMPTAQILQTLCSDHFSRTSIQPVTPAMAAGKKIYNIFSIAAAAPAPAAAAAAPAPAAAANNRKRAHNDSNTIIRNTAAKFAKHKT